MINKNLIVNYQLVPVMKLGVALQIKTAQITAYIYSITAAAVAVAVAVAGDNNFLYSNYRFHLSFWAIFYYFSWLYTHIGTGT